MRDADDFAASVSRQNIMSATLILPFEYLHAEARAAI